MRIAHLPWMSAESTENKGMGGFRRTGLTY